MTAMSVFSSAPESLKVWRILQASVFCAWTQRTKLRPSRLAWRLAAAAGVCWGPGYLVSGGGDS